MRARPDWAGPEETSPGATAWMQSLLTCLGFVTLIIQVTLIRQLLVLFAGNDLFLGMILPLWLLGFAGGSSLGARIAENRHRLLAVVILPVTVLFPATIAFMRNARHFMGMTSGANLLPGEALLLATICILPTAFILGLQYPLAVSILGGDDRAASRAYRLEAIGAFLGGLFFVFFLSTRVDGVSLATAAAAALALIMAPLAGSRRLALLALVPLVLQAALPGSIRAPVLAGYETLQVGE